jgi:hypothetical protein
MIRPLDNFLERVERVQQSSDGHRASCPNPLHGKGRGDINPSLSVTTGEDGRVLLKCHAGCSLEDILGAMGLDKRDLFERNDSWEGGLFPPWKDGQHVNTLVPPAWRTTRSTLVYRSIS